MNPLTVLLWKWGNRFQPHFVNRMRAMLERHLRLPHEVALVTDNSFGVDDRVRIIALPVEFRDTPRCRRRMRQYDAEFAEAIGAERILSIDLDVVLVDDITPIVDCADPLKLWRVGYAGVFSGSFQLFDAGVLDGLFREFAADPEGYPKRAWPTGIGSDQAMLNYYLRGQTVPHWTERDGFVTYFGRGYERFANQGVALAQPRLPPGARLVVFGSDDISDMESGAFDWVRKHWKE